MAVRRKRPIQIQMPSSRSFRARRSKRTLSHVQPCFAQRPDHGRRVTITPSPCNFRERGGEACRPRGPRRAAIRQIAREAPKLIAATSPRMVK